MRNRAAFYTIFIFFLFFGSLFWLLITTGVGRDFFTPPSTTFKGLFLAVTWLSSALCMYASIRALSDCRQPSSFVHHAALLLSGITVLALVITTFVFGFLYWG
jgi:hypothetical protein